MTDTDKYELFCFDIDGTLIRSFLREGAGRHMFDAIEVLPGRIEKLTELRDTGALIALVTNQGGVAFGYQTEEQVRQKLRRVAGALDLDASIWITSGATDVTALPALARAYVAYEHPKAKLPEHRSETGWRKPGPGMLAQAMVDFGVRPDRVLFVGDMDSDREAAAAAGVEYVDAADFFGSGDVDA
jgi:D-glycero-D-manno-heptose 1,7-bisphosphate phosphatase